jgi:hypothetical protein
VDREIIPLENASAIAFGKLTGGVYQDKLKSPFGLEAEILTEGREYN